MPLDAQNCAARSVGDYDLLHKIADGGMGSVYKARDRTTGALVAVKVMDPEKAAHNKVLLKRFEREFRLAGALAHPNIVRVLDYGLEGRTPYLVMEFVDGENLGERIEREGCLAEDEAVRLIIQVAGALGEIHKQGMIHRDVKPDNILLTGDGQVKLTDLGLAKGGDTNLDLTRAGSGLGTPCFIAPEQFREAKYANQRCDLYALAATLYAAVTGQLPFGDCNLVDAWAKKLRNELPPPRQLVPTLSERVDWAIRRAMSADPSRRPASCREFVEDLTGRSASGVQTSAANGPPDGWFLAYTDEHGVGQTAQGDLDGLRRSLREGRLGEVDNVRASPSEAGPFEPLRAYPEYRDLVIDPAALPIPGATPNDRPTKSGKRKASAQPPGTTPPRSTPAPFEGPTVQSAPGETDDGVLDWLTYLLAGSLVAGGFLFGLWLLAR